MERERKNGERNPTKKREREENEDVNPSKKKRKEYDGEENTIRKKEEEKKRRVREITDFFLSFFKGYNGYFRLKS